MVMGGVDVMRKEMWVMMMVSVHNRGRGHVAAVGVGCGGGVLRERDEKER